MSKINDGGPAFPVVYDSNCPSVDMGMSLRDWFAGQALAGLLSNADASAGSGDWSWRSGTLTGDTYLYADAMLQSREATNG